MTNVLKTLLIISIAFIGVLHLQSCTDDDPEPGNTLTSDAGSDQNVSVGEQVQLDGSGSADDEGNALTYNWQFTTIPTNSTAQLDGSTTANPTFTPDLEGTYRIQLTVSNGNDTDSDEVVINAAVSSSTIELSGTIADDITLTDIHADPNVPDYCVVDDVRLEAIMTIEPGVVIAVVEDKAFEVSGDEAAMIAVGTANSRIEFRSKEANEHWRGLGFILSDNVQNELNFVDIIDGGSDLISIADERAGLVLGSFSELKISNTRVQNSASYGMVIEANAEVSGFTENSFSNNDGRPLRIDVEYMHMLDANSAYSDNNGEDIIEVTGTDLDINEAITWQTPQDDTPFLITNNLEIESKLSVEAGFQLFIESNIGVQVSGDDAYLDAQGTESNPIIITAYNQNLPWKGLGFVLTDNVQNSLEHVEISYGGLDNVSILEDKATLGIGSFSRVAVSNCYIHHSSSNGIYIDNTSEFLTFLHNRIEESTQLPMILTIDNLHMLDPGTAIGKSHGSNYVKLEGGDIDFSETVTWNPLEDGTPFVVTEHIEIESGLVLNPGLNFMMGSNLEFLVEGYMKAVGTPENPIEFTAFDTSLPWRGIAFYSDDVRNELDYVNVSYGGSDVIVINDVTANVSVHSFDQLSITNCELSNGAGYGLYYHQNSTVTSANNTYSDNVLGDVLVQQ